VKALRVNRYLVPVLAVLALLGSVWVAKAAGAWQTSGRGEILLDESGQPDPSGIKGWMTLDDISGTYGIPMVDLYILIGAAEDAPSETALKDLEKVLPGMEVSAVRTGVAAYLAGLWEPGDGRYGEGEVPQVPALPTETPTPSLEPTRAPAVQGTAVDHIPQGQGAGSAEGFVLPQDCSRLPGSEIKGRMTLQEVVDYCQVPLEYLVAELGLPGEVDTAVRMRDLANQMGIEVVTVREVVEGYQAGP
jgi:hypothetical protein